MSTTYLFVGITLGIVLYFSTGLLIAYLAVLCGFFDREASSCKIEYFSEDGVVLAHHHRNRLLREVRVLLPAWPLFLVYITFVGLWRILGWLPRGLISRVEDTYVNTAIKRTPTGREYYAKRAAAKRAKDPMEKGVGEVSVADDGALSYPARIKG